MYNDRRVAYDSIMIPTTLNNMWTVYTSLLTGSFLTFIIMAVITAAAAVTVADTLLKMMGMRRG